MLRNEGTKKRNGARSVFALVVLFAALLASASGVSFAKNLSSSTGGDNAQVSALIIDLRVSSSDNLAIDCGQEIMTAEYHFTVANTKDGKTAETSFKYDVIVTLPEALPEGISVTVDGKIGRLRRTEKRLRLKTSGVLRRGIRKRTIIVLFFTWLT